MRKINRKFILIFTFVIFVLVTGTSAYASGTFSSLFPDVSPEHQELAKQVENRLNQSWNKGLEALQKSNERGALAVSSKDEDLSNWTFVDFNQLDDKVASFSRDEGSSFLDAFYSKERRENLDVGDYMPALLLNPDETEGLVYWEKADGSYVVIDLKTKSDDSDSWYVNGVKKIATP